MKYLALVLVSCGVAALALSPEKARAFDIQGEKASVQDGVQPFTSPADQFLAPDFTQGSSLALPYVGKSDNSGFVSDYGNSITIPGPGVDKAAPVWAYR
ncbi:MAG TPA: hypothetical protein VHK26_01270 [Methyloceanibacter sp.]|jgi:hypothetical protein|nr:hypothetical protein [Methyloceanibacter sp.]